MAKKILVVDDEIEMNELICTRLEMKGFEVISAQDGMEGLEKARNEVPDLIILDVMMPKLNGYQVCRMLKFDDKYKSIPIIFLTAKSQQYDLEVGKEVKADAYLSKPFDGETLLKEVNRLLSKGES